LDQRLEIPEELLSSSDALELVAVWHYQNKIKILTRTGTNLDSSPETWGEILAAIAKNVALAIEGSNQQAVKDRLEVIKERLDRCWEQ